MLEDKEVFIHIGYPKTASTTMQNEIFSKSKDIFYVGKPLTHQNELMQKFIHIITDRENYEYKQEYNNFIKKIVKPLFSTRKNKILISEETFSTGSSLSGKVDRLTIAKRLYDLFPNAKIIMTIRNQFDIIKSSYLQKYKLNPKYELPFNDWLNENYQKLHIANAFSQFDYRTTVNSYETYFGRNVKIFVFEELINDNFASICNYIGIKKSKEKVKTENPATSTTEIFIGRYVPTRLTSFLKQHFPNLFKICKKLVSTKSIKHNPKYTDFFYDFISNYYAKSNKNLQTKYKLKLDKYKYPGLK